MLIALYVAALVFTLVTHEHLFRTPEEGERPAWSKRQAIVMLLLATALVALMSEFLVELAGAGARRRSGCPSSSWG